MQAVTLGVVEKRVVRAGVGIEPGVRICVHNLRGPHVPRLLHDGHVVVDEEPELIRVRLVGLNVLLRECCKTAVDRREKHEA